MKVEIVFHTEKISITSSNLPYQPNEIIGELLKETRKMLIFLEKEQAHRDYQRLERINER